MLQPERGQLKVSMYANSGLLTVCVGQARNLQSKWQEKCNSYVKVSLYPEDEDSSTKCKTVLVKNNNSPSYEEKFSFELLEEDLKRRVLITLWHKEINGRSEFLGCMSFGIQHIVSNRRIVNGWYYLLTEKLGKRKHLQVPSQSEHSADYDPSLIPSINQGVNWMEPHVFVLKKDAESSYGFEVSGYGPARVAYIANGSVAESMGLQLDDRIVRINGCNVSRSGEESVSRIVRSCEKQLILEVHRPRRASHGNDDVSFVRGSEVMHQEPANSASSQHGLYEEIHESALTREAPWRPQPCGTSDRNSSVFGDRFKHYAPLQGRHHVVDRGTNTHLSSRQVRYDDINVDALSPIVSRNNDHHRGNNRCGKSSSNDLGYLDLEHYSPDAVYCPTEKFNFISQWRDEVNESCQPNKPALKIQNGRQDQLYSQNCDTLSQNGRYYNQAIGGENRMREPIRRRDRAYESEDGRGMRWQDRDVHRCTAAPKSSQAHRPDRAYESEGGRGMRWNERKQYTSQPSATLMSHRSQSQENVAASRHMMLSYNQENAPSNVNAMNVYNQMHTISRDQQLAQYMQMSQNAYAQQSMHASQNGQSLRNLHMSQNGQQQQNVYVSHKHLMPILEEEEENIAMTQHGSAHARRINNLKMAAKMDDFSPPYMKAPTKKSTKSESKPRSLFNENKDTGDSLSSDDSELSKHISKRHYQPIGEEDTKFKSKRVLQPIGQEEAKPNKPYKSKALFSFCGGLQTKQKKKAAKS